MGELSRENRDLVDRLRTRRQVDPAGIKRHTFTHEELTWLLEEARLEGRVRAIQTVPLAAFVDYVDLA